MDHRQFDRWTQTLSERLTRRGLGRLGASVFFLVALAAMPPAEIAGRRRRKKKGNGGSPGPLPKPPPSPGAVIATYHITIDGKVNGTSFRRTGELTLRRPFLVLDHENDANPIEVCLLSGNPSTAPSPGAIRFGSSSGCFVNTPFDVGYVTKPSATRIAVEPDPVLAYRCHNKYTASSNLGAFVYSPYTGGLLVELQEGGSQVIGVIDTQGLGNCLSPVGSRYQAIFAGTRRS